MANNIFMTLGTKSISYELFRNIDNGITNKPLGGLWMSPCNEENIEASSWIQYLKDKPELVFHKSYDKGCIIEVDPESDIYIVDSVNSYKELLKYCNMNSFGNPSWIDFEKMFYMSYDLDPFQGILIEVSKLPKKLKEKGAPFDKFGVDTLILFDLSCISSYKTMDIDWSFGEDDNSYNISDIKRGIPKVSKEYFDLVSRLESLFKPFLHEIIHPTRFNLNRNIAQEIQKLRQFVFLYLMQNKAYLDVVIAKSLGIKKDYNTMYNLAWAISSNLFSEELYEYRRNLEKTLSLKRLYR